jgi:hypothetical protein
MRPETDIESLMIDRTPSERTNIGPRQGEKNTQAFGRFRSGFPQKLTRS